MIGDKTKPIRPSTGQTVGIKRWPTERRSEGLGLSAKDGWNFFLGGGAAIIVVIILAQLILGCALFMALGAMGASLGGLM